MFLYWHLNLIPSFTFPSEKSSSVTVYQTENASCQQTLYNYKTTDFKMLQLTFGSVNIVKINPQLLFFAELHWTSL